MSDNEEWEGLPFLVPPPLNIENSPANTGEGPSPIIYEGDIRFGGMLEYFQSDEEDDQPYQEPVATEIVPGESPEAEAIPLARVTEMQPEWVQYTDEYFWIPVYDDLIYPSDPYIWHPMAELYYPHPDPHPLDRPPAVYPWDDIPLPTPFATLGRYNQFDPIEDN